MADAGRAPDTANWNPVFAQRLAAFRDALTKAGINSSISSGYRSPEYQNQMYQNHLAKAAKQPLPYPNVEAPSVVAPAWRSFHNYGIAADLHLDNPNDYTRMAEMARQFGLSGIGPTDPGHIQLAGTLADNIAQYKLASWRPDNRPAPDTGAIVYDGPPAGQPPPSLVARGTTPPQGTTINSYPQSRTAATAAQRDAFNRAYATSIGVNPDLVTGISKAEGLNAPGAGPSQVDVSGGQPFSFGDFQLNIHPGAMGAAALKAGIDPRDPNQWQAANKFAIDQMKAGGVGPWKGDPVAAAYIKSGAVPEATGPIDPSIAAHGGSSPAIPTTPGTTINSTPTVAGVTTGQWGQVGQNLKDTGKALGLPDDDAKDQGQQEIKPSPMIGPAPQARNVSLLLGGPGGVGQGQVSPAYAQRMAALNQPMTWGSAPPGQMPGTGYGPQAQPLVYGTSLASNLQRSLDPMWMNSWGT